jgi:hypothetical protein
MARLPAYDGRLMHLGEAQELLGYARKMETLLALHWRQQEAELAQRCKQAGYAQEDYESEYQFEEYQHTKYEVYLDGQLVIAAWSLLQGAVGHCAAFLADHLNVEKKLSSVKLKGKPTEANWQHYYDHVLGTSWPLNSDHEEIVWLRTLRNDYGHSLFFEPFSVRARLGKIRPDAMGEQSDFRYSIGEFVALQGQGVPACELAARSVEKLKAHATALFPHDGVSFSIWERKS